jgi:biopolymer transport protein ExbD
MAHFETFDKQIFVCTIALFAVVLCAPAYGQRSKPKIKPPVVKPVAAIESEPLPGYDFDIKVFADGSVQLQVVTGYETRGLSNPLLEKALTEYVEMTSYAAGKKVSPPHIFIRPDPGVDLKRLMEIARSARKSGSAELQIVTPDNIALKIGPEPKELGDINIKPNPLTLVVAIHKDKSVTLNNEAYGSSSDPSPLGGMLKKVFRDREDNGVFRPGTNEVEKTLNIMADMPARFSDLIAVAKAVGDAGAGPIFLVVDDDQFGVRRLDLIPVP